VAKFIRDAFEAVVCELPFRDNYFWRVYLQGFYTPDCCPEYLKPENFEALRQRLDRLKIHSMPLVDFLRGSEPGISKFVLLDHMDWLSCYNPTGLVEEWDAILSSARPGARAIYRSAGLRVDYLDHLRVRYRGLEADLGSLLRYHPEQMAALHARDRVHTYGSFYIADLPGSAGG
jgi:S-adenosylmethionine-diacylglycerol 3-amino-3-carboxypropyl transferase